MESNAQAVPVTAIVERIEGLIIAGNNLIIIHTPRPPASAAAQAIQAALKRELGFRGVVLYAPPDWKLERLSERETKKLYENLQLQLEGKRKGAGMDPRRRLAVALLAYLDVHKVWDGHGVSSEKVQAEVRKAIESDRPEQLLPAEQRWRFWNQLTLEELGQLVDEYYVQGYPEDERGAQAAIGLKDRAL